MHRAPTILLTGQLTLPVELPPSCHLCLSILSIIGQTPLIKAAWYGHTEACKYLIEAGANVTHKDTKHGADALHCAVQARAISTWNILLERGADPDTTLSNGKDVIWLLLVYPETPVQHVAKFLELGASPTSVDVMTGRSTLHRAAGTGQTGVIKILLKYGADVSHADDEGRTPLHEGAAEGQYWSVWTLIELGADVHARTKDGKTALHYAVHGMDVDVVRHLLATGADVNTQDKRGWSALMYACRGRNYSAFSDGRRLDQPHDSLSVIGELLAGGASTLHVGSGGRMSPNCSSLPARGWRRAHMSDARHCILPPSLAGRVLSACLRSGAQVCTRQMRAATVRCTVRARAAMCMSFARYSRVARETRREIVPVAAR
jgi:ankyrin repeat protein